VLQDQLEGVVRLRAPIDGGQDVEEDDHLRGRVVTLSHCVPKIAMRTLQEQTERESSR